MTEKKPFDVYVEITRSFDNEITVQRFFAGETFAVSERKAISNVRYRIEGKVPNYYSDSRGDDWRSHFYIAVPKGTKVQAFEARGEE